jgi:hypothetical protein
VIRHFQLCMPYGIRTISVLCADAALFIRRIRFLLRGLHPGLGLYTPNGLIRPQKLGIDPSLQATVLHLPTCSCEPRAFGGGPKNAPVCRRCRPAFDYPHFGPDAIGKYLNRKNRL